MTRCPNCGSAIRIGAKFCTSCGFRLMTEEPVAVPSRSPFATTSSASWSAAPDPVDDVVIEAAPAARVDPEPEPAWSKQDTIVEVPPADDAVVAVSPTGDAEVIEMAPVATDGNDRPGRSWFSPAPPDRSVPVDDDMVASLDSGSSDQLVADTGEAAPPDPGLGTEESTPTRQPADDGEVIFTSSSGSSNATSAAGATALTGTTMAASPPDVSAETHDRDSLTEARALVARLDDLLARMPSGGSSTSRSQVTPTVGADESDVEALRAVVSSARARPRDVDVMLDLVLRADTIAAVIEDRALLLAALRGDETAVEEAWSTDDEQPSTYPAWGAP